MQTDPTPRPAVPTTSPNYAVMVETYKRVAQYSDAQRAQIEKQMIKELSSASALVSCGC